MDRLVIDRARLEDASGGDAEFLRELVDIYLEDAEVRLSELKEALISADSDSFGRTAHQLKGSSANMGAVSVSDWAKQLEQAGKTDGLAKAADMLPELEQAFARVRDELSSMVGV